MKYTKWFAGLALAIGMSITGTSTLSAAEPYGRNAYWDRQDMKSDYSRIARLRAEIAADRARLREDMRYGRQWQVRRDREELARDQRMLDALLRQTQYNRDGRYDRGASYDYRDR